MKRLMKIVAGMAIAAGLAAPAAAADKKEIVVAEPLHSLGYLPLYVAIRKGYFDEEGLSVKILTVESGSGHTNAVLTKQAFAFIGGPEHNAFAKAKGAELRAVVNVVNRGNVYLVAKPGAIPQGADLKTMLSGKTIATGYFGGTPNSITRYLVGKAGLDAKKDVTLSELATAGIMALLKTGAAQIGVLSEPMLTQGVRQGLWAEPVYNVPVELGPYAYSTLNIRQESIINEPEVVKDFVRAVSRGLKSTYDNPTEAAEIARKEFPTMALEDLKSTLDRSFKDEIWSKDGTIAQEAWATGKSVVMEAGILKQDVPYGDIIDMRFLETVKASLN
jgi:NitT/TauT family transport system substrate-binding protein